MDFNRCAMLACFAESQCKYPHDCHHFDREPETNQRGELPPEPVIEERKGVEVIGDWGVEGFVAMLGRLEPDLAPMPRDMALSSIAISLARIANLLEHKFVGK